MAENDNDLNNNDPAGLRAALEKANKKAAEAEKLANDRAAELRTVKIETLLTGQKVDASKFAKFVPTDLDPTPEAIKSWMTEYKDVYNFGTSESVPPAVTNTATAPAASAADGGEPVTPKKNALDGIDPQMLKALETLGIIEDVATAASGAERVQLREALAQANPVSLGDAKDILKGFGIEMIDSGGYSDQFSSPIKPKS